MTQRLVSSPLFCLQLKIKSNVSMLRKTLSISVHLIKIFLERSGLTTISYCHVAIDLRSGIALYCGQDSKTILQVILPWAEPGLPQVRGGPLGPASAPKLFIILICITIPNIFS